MKKEITRRRFMKEFSCLFIVGLFNHSFITNFLRSMSQYVQNFYKKRLATGLPTGFIDLDNKIKGLQPSELMIIAGRPGVGKTAFALNIAQYAAVKKKITTALFSVEMAKEQLVLRMLCSEARVDPHKLSEGILEETDWQKLTRVAGIISEAPIFVNDTPALSVLEMRKKAKRLMVEHELGLIIVDYLQLMRMRGLSGRVRLSTDERKQEMYEITKSLKSLAKELDVPVIALSQLNRGVEERADIRPQLADLKKSGITEQDADLILFLCKDDICYGSSKQKGIKEIIVAKNQRGPTGTVQLVFNRKYKRFDKLNF